MLLSANLIILIESPGGFPQHELKFAESSPPDPRISGLELWLPLVEEVDQVGRDREKNRLRWNLEDQPVEKTNNTTGRCCF